MKIGERLWDIEQDDHLKFSYALHQYGIPSETLILLSIKYNIRSMLIDALLNP